MSASTSSNGQGARTMNLAPIHMQPNEAAIEAIEQLLADAEAGRITDYALIAHWVGGEVGSTFDCSSNTMAMIGEIRVLERDIMDCCVDKRMHEAGREY